MARVAVKLQMPLSVAVQHSMEQLRMLDEEAGHIAAREMAESTQSRYVAAAACWSEDGAKALRTMMDDLNRFAK